MMDLDELERKAMAATPGPRIVVDDGEPCFQLPSWPNGADITVADAALAAACSPETVLALVRVAKAAQEWLDHGPGQSHCEEEDCPCTSTVCQLKKATAALSPDAKGQR